MAVGGVGGEGGQDGEGEGLDVVALVRTHEPLLGVFVCEEGGGAGVRVAAIAMCAGEAGEDVLCERGAGAARGAARPMAVARAAGPVGGVVWRQRADDDERAEVDECVGGELGEGEGQGGVGGAGGGSARRRGLGVGAAGGAGAGGGAGVVARLASVVEAEAALGGDVVPRGGYGGGGGVVGEARAGRRVRQRVCVVNNPRSPIQRYDTLTGVWLGARATRGQGVIQTAGLLSDIPMPGPLRPFPTLYNSWGNPGTHAGTMTTTPSKHTYA